MDQLGKPDRLVGYINRIGTCRLVYWLVRLTRIGRLVYLLVRLII